MEKGTQPNARHLVRNRSEGLTHAASQLGLKGVGGPSPKEADK